MAFLFSNPTPDPQNDPAKLQSGFKVDAPNIGTLVSAILESRYRQAELQRQQQQDLTNGINAAGKGIAAYQQQGSANDSANAAMYFQQNPGAYQEYLRTGQMPTGSIPDYGGTDATDQFKLQQGMIANQLQDQQAVAKINAMNALASQRSGSGGMGAPNIYTDPNTGQQYYQNSRSGYSALRGTGNAGTPQLTPGQQATQNRATVSQIQDQLGNYPTSALGAPTNAGGDFDPSGRWLPNSPDQEQDPSYQSPYVSLGGQPLPYNKANPAEQNSNVYPRADYQRMVDQYRAATGAGQSGSLLPGATSAPSPLPQASAQTQAPAVSTNAGLAQDTQDAQAAIAQGRDRNAVVARLAAKYPGTDFSGL